MPKRNLKKLFILSDFAILLYCGLMLYISALAQGNTVSDAQDRPDPFVPLISADGVLLNLNNQSQETPEVNGIIYDKQGVSYAIVNSTVVAAGESIGDYKVLRIEEDKVVFEKNGQPLEVGIYKEE